MNQKSDFAIRGARPVWIASYPRSGNTFLRIILEKVFQLPSYSIYYAEGAKHRDPSADALEDAPRLPEDWRQRLKQNQKGPWVAIKTHDAPEDSSPAIYIARDGRAAIDSYYHYHKKFAFEQPSLTEIIAGACQFGSWSGHYRAWQPKTRPNTLFLLYDELVGSPATVVVKLAEFLKLSAGTTALPNFAELQQKLPAFFRRGQNSDYLKSWMPSQLALFNELHASAMNDLGFPIVQSQDSALGTLKELADTAARLHRLYLEGLTKLGEGQLTHHKELERLTSQLQGSTQQRERLLQDWLKKRWIRVGLALGALESPPKPASADSSSRQPTKESSSSEAGAEGLKLPA